MVADLTRFTACKVHPDTPGQPLPEEPVAVPGPDAPQGGTTEPKVEEPVRLFVWASA